MQHYVVVVPDGVGVRNFILGDFLRLASKDARITVLHAIPDGLLGEYCRPFNGAVRWERLQTYSEPALTGLLRYAIAYSHMYMYSSGSLAMRYNRSRPIRGSWRRRVGRRAAKTVGWALSSRSGIAGLEYLHRRSASRGDAVECYRSYFAESSPSIVFCSHQRPPETLPAILAAKSLGIPTATFIFSWDNLTSKGRIAAPFDHFLVWSDLMKRQLLQFYPDVAPGRVHVVGTPQFDPYEDDSLLSTREEFFTEIGADPRRPLICYSGGDLGTCPEDALHVRLLMQLVRSAQIEHDPQVLLRPSPVDGGARYDDVRRDYPDLLFCRPRWQHYRPDQWSQAMPTAADVRFLANLTRHADVNVNVASTMTLDFALNDTPVVNIGFDMSSPPPLGLPLADLYYQFEHYRPVIELGAARLATSAAELAELINMYIKDPSADARGRQLLVEREVSQRREASSVLLATLAGLARDSAQIVAHR